ncbi:MAG: transposase [Moraxellaceae bacterium]|nr:transposase [Moraxellaceae bacterium]MCP5176031.1 transposase [Moraxellaceae bacterium]
MKTLKLRIKDKHSKVLNQLASAVNFVWNYVNDLCFKHLQRTGKFFSAFDIAKYTAGASKELNLHSQTIQAITEELVLRRKQFKKAKLKWRVSNPHSAKKSLGWIPFKKTAIKYQHGQIKYGNHHWFSLWDSYGLNKYTVKTGAFVQDSRGRWYVCLVVDSSTTLTKPAPSAVTEQRRSVGIDLGLKDLATLSNGQKIQAQRTYRKYEKKLGIAQRARNKKRVKAIHAKIKQIRHNHLHQESTKLVKHYAAIFVGNINAKSLAKTKLAKSVLDAGWTMFRTLLKYKCENAGVWFEEVNESYTTQTCSCCGSRQNSPKGRAGLGIREWTCVQCGTLHDRDINAAKNILALGHERLGGGIPLL